MADLIDRSFEGLAGDLLHRGRKKKEPSPPPPEPPEESWDSHPIRRTDPTTKVNGQPVVKEFFYIGALAKALDKRPNTLRAWIRKGWLPKPMYLTSRRIGTKGDAGRRLWTRSQVENIRRIAEEEEILGEGRHPDIRHTQFTQKVVAGFRDWK